MTDPPSPCTFEIVGNFHLHTTSSDGSGSHAQVAEAAAQAGLDVIAYTDHNVWLAGQEGWYEQPGTGKRVLLLMGEEVHDEQRCPEASHYLCLGAGHDVAEYASAPQTLITAVNRHGGAGFIAHPVERAAPLFGELALPWLDWEVHGYTGIELWNYMSEFKACLSSKSAAVLAAFFPELFISGPFPETLALWDDLLCRGRKVAAIGGADAHANVYSLGGLRRAIFPYVYLFRAVNTHLILDAPFSDNFDEARSQVLNGLQAGRAFVAYDLAGGGRGFRFTATVGHASVPMGGTIELDGPATLRAVCPRPAHLRLIQDGQPAADVYGRELIHTTRTPGVFRVEAYRRYRRKRRAWIFSNPIYIREL
jgi:hypothetical protein